MGSAAAAMAPAPLPASGGAQLLPLSTKGATGAALVAGAGGGGPFSAALAAAFSAAALALAAALSLAFCCFCSGTAALAASTTSCRDGGASPMPVTSTLPWMGAALVCFGAAASSSAVISSGGSSKGRHDTSTSPWNGNVCTWVADNPLHTVNPGFAPAVVVVARCRPSGAHSAAATGPVTEPILLSLGLAPSAMRLKNSTPPWPAADVKQTKDPNGLQRTPVLDPSLSTCRILSTTWVCFDQTQRVTVLLGPPMTTNSSFSGLQETAAMSVVVGPVLSSIFCKPPSLDTLYNAAAASAAWVDASRVRTSTASPEGAHIVVADVVVLGNSWVPSVSCLTILDVAACTIEMEGTSTPCSSLPKHQSAAR
mmetsp:Transcript_54098/g.144049  ORF Transcript_54098/g.144049 Transcript_54098/m.144049 type:complete len:368 (-) Transcript_54098:591-1694(-)